MQYVGQMDSLLGRIRRPDITFHKGGRIDITARVGRLLGLSVGDAIDIMFDGIEYYLYIRHKKVSQIGRYEAQCFPTKSNSMNFRAHSSRLCSRILKITGKDSVAAVSVGECIKYQGEPAVTLIIQKNIL